MCRNCINQFIRAPLVSQKSNSCFIFSQNNELHCNSSTPLSHFECWITNCSLLIFAWYVRFTYNYCCVHSKNFGNRTSWQRKKSDLKLTSNQRSHAKLGNFPLCACHMPQLVDKIESSIWITCSHRQSMARAAVMHLAFWHRFTTTQTSMNNIFKLKQMTSQLTCRTSTWFMYTMRQRKRMNACVCTTIMWMLSTTRPKCRIEWLRLLTAFLCLSVVRAKFDSVVSCECQFMLYIIHIPHASLCTFLGMNQ